MASLEIIGDSSNNTQGGGSSSSVIQVGYELMMNDDQGSDLRSAPLIFRVTKPLRDSIDHFYSPHLVSIGPFHYGRPELSGMEKHKSEAVRRMQKRMQSRDPQVTIKSIVEGYKAEKDKKIRDFYGENISYSSIELAWMVTRDACFVFEFIINYMKHIGECHSVYEEMRVSSSKYDPIFDVCFQNPRRDRLMDDILLFENQIPLFILQHLLQIQMGSLDVANEKLDVIMNWVLLCSSRQIVFPSILRHPHHKCCHALEVIYYCMVGQNLKSYLNEARQLFPSTYKCVPVWFKNAVRWIKAIFASCCKLCSNCMVCLNFPFPTTSNSVEVLALGCLKLPSAVELNNKGVKLHPMLDEIINRWMPGYSAIHLIRFDEKTSTLYLPEVRVTTHSESLMRSIIAMEVSSEEERYYPRPITQFAKLMDELVDSEEDVAVLRKAGIIMNHLGSNKEAAQVFNSLTKEIMYGPGCKPIDDVRSALRRYTKRKYKILWSEFVSAYFSKPWLVAGSVGATLLVAMTAVQVFCLFYSCSR